MALNHLDINTLIYETQYVKILRNYGIPRRISELIENLGQLQHVCDNFNPDRDDVPQYINLSAVEFATPLSILPLTVFGYNNLVEIICSETDPNVLKYLETIAFPYGVEEFSRIGKSYLPIMRVPADGGIILRDYEDRILSQVSNGQEIAGLRNSLKYLTGELQTNIKEHSRSDLYWMLAQYYPRSNICEIVIADTGVGYKESYKNTPNQVDTDVEAIYNAVDGFSSKPSKYFNERGLGLRSILNLFTNYYGGNLVIMSGRSIVYFKQKAREELHLSSYWNGAVVAINFEIKAIDSNLFSKYIDI